MHGDDILTRTIIPTELLCPTVLTRNMGDGVSSGAGVGEGGV